MGEQCKESRSWEEEMFWTHFQSTHFAQFLRGRFDHQLVLPEKFSKHFKQRLPSTVTLKGPSGNVWEVGLATIDETLFFKHGWQDFVNDHSLKENDFLVFKYNGVANFDVLMFEGQNMCEKASSYFVRKCSHTGVDNGCQTKRKLEENPPEVIHFSEDCDLEGTPEKTIDKGINPRLPKRSIISTGKKKMHKGVCSIRPVRASWSAPASELPSAAELEVMSDMVSSRQPAMSLLEEQQKKALDLAQSVLTDNGFMVVMKRSHVRTKFFMTIPTAWLLKNLFLRSQDVILRINQHTWKAKFSYYKVIDRCKKTGERSYGGFSGGWKTFVAENNLEENDVCVFEPENPLVRPIVFNVSIFHVQQAAVPLTDVASTSC